MPATEQMTAEEFLALPEAQLGRPWNLVEGEVVVNQPSVEHQEIADRVILELAKWVENGTERGFVIRPLDILIDDRNVYAPDALWYAAGRRPRRGETAPYPMPELAVEVRSPSTWRYDIGAKRAGYERKGLRELWLVDTAVASVLVFRRSTPDAPTFDVALDLASGGTLESPLLEGFSLPIDRLFAED